MKILLSCLFACIVLAGCGKEAASSANDKAPRPITTAPPTAPKRNVPLSSYGRSHISVKHSVIDVYVADERAERADGLMFVEDDELGDDEGMVFVFSGEEQLSFWMENTLIPLDIAFLDASGKILNILQMKALDPTPQPSAGPAQYAVEMHVGWFEKKGIKAGDKFDLSALSK